MKIKNIIAILFTIVWAMAGSGCDDFLDVESDTQLNGDKEDVIKSYEELRKLTAFLYATPWSSWANRYMFTVSDARGNNIYNDSRGNLSEYCCFSETGSTGGLSNTWNAMYNVIAQSGYIINNYAPAALKYVDKEFVNICIGEAKFMRGLAYWYLAMFWHDVPIIKNPMDYTFDSFTYPSRFEDVLQYAIYDLEVAAQYLPETDMAGRVTKYSAEGILARIYLSLAGYASGGFCSQDMHDRYGMNTVNELATYFYTRAKKLSKEVIDNAEQYQLMDDYEQIFRVQNNNCKEVLFALQVVPGQEDAGVRNENNGFAGYCKELTDNLVGGGGGNKVSYDIVTMYIDDGARSRARGNIFLDGEVYNYLGTHTINGYWKVGYIDDQRKNTTKCFIKKQCIGSKEDAGGVILQNNSGFKTPMLRMAEIYLMHAEACIRLKNLSSEPEELKISKTVDPSGAVMLAESEAGVEEFFKVRQRAYGTDVEGFQKYLEAKDKLTMNDLYKEYRLEFFMEGLWWQMLVRRGFYDSWVLRFLNNEFRQEETGSDNYGWTNFAGYAYTYDIEKESYKNNNGFSSDSPRPNSTLPLPNVRHSMKMDDWVHSKTANDNFWAYPYPISEVTEDPYLEEKPIKYDFNNYK